MILIRIAIALLTVGFFVLGLTEMILDRWESRGW